MAAFGGGAPSNNGHGASSAQASPWDLGGLDPVPLMGQVRMVTRCHTCDDNKCLKDKMFGVDAECEISRLFKVLFC